MMKFASFENIVAAIYGYLPKEKSEYSKLVQTEVSFAGGYLGASLFQTSQYVCLWVINN